MPCSDASRRTAGVARTLPGRFPLASETGSRDVLDSGAVVVSLAAREMERKRAGKGRERKKEKRGGEGGREREKKDKKM